MKDSRVKFGGPAPRFSRYLRKISAGDIRPRPCEGYQAAGGQMSAEHGWAYN